MAVSINGLNILGNTIFVGSGSTPTVSNIAANTNKIRFMNGNATSICYVGVFNNYTDAAASGRPLNGGPSGFLIPIAPYGDEIVTGNFGLTSTSANANVYVVTTASAASGVVVFATPLTP